MPISYTEPTIVTCPYCGKPFEAEIWTLIDVGEQPDLYDALLNGSLNLVTCPHCGQSSPPSSPLLLHDPILRRVYFAVPGEADEHVWREHAQTLLYALVGSLPEEARLPYLGDVQISQGLDGLRHSLLRRGRRGRPEAARDRANTGGPVVSNPLASSPLLDAIQVLLAADSPAEFQDVVRSHPDLLSETAHGLFEALIAEAKRANEPDAVQAIQKVRATLQKLQSAASTTPTSNMPAPAASPIQQQTPSVQADLRTTELEQTTHPEQVPSTPFLSTAAYQEFLAASSPEDITAAASSHPVLLEAQTDVELGLRAEEALDSGNERLAALIDERRDVLAALRQELTHEVALRAAVEALLAAESEEDLAHVLSEYPALLTSAAQETLRTMADDARVRDDEQFAIDAVECSAMLREVRRGLDG